MTMKHASRLNAFAVMRSPAKPGHALKMLGYALLALFLSFSSASAQVPTGGLQVWLRAGDITGVTNGQPVSTWSAAPGSTVQATSTGAFRPTFVTNAINGQPVVRFTGNGGETKDQPLMSANITTGATVTAFVVLASQLAGNPPLPDNRVDVVMGTKVDFPATGFALSTYNSFAGRGGRVIRPEGGSGNNGTVTIRKNGGEGITSLNASEYAIATYIGSGLQNGGASGSPLIIGSLRDSVRAGSHDIAEVLVYNRVLTAAEVSQVESYLGTRYAITLVRPDGLLAWLRAEDITGVTNGQPVSTWPGFQSLPGASSTGTFRPTFVANALNGRPAVRFTGNGGETRDQPLMQANVSTGSVVTALFVFASQRQGAAPLPENTVDVLMATKNDFPATGFGISTYNSFSGRGGRAIRSEGGNGNNGTTSIRKNGSTADVGIAAGEYAIGTYTGTGLSNSGTSGNPLLLGSLRDSLRAGTNDLVEVIIYGRQLSRLELDSAERALSMKYNIPLVTNITSIPSNGLQLWLTPEEVTGLTGSAVSTWFDRSVNRAHAVSNGTAAPVVGAGPNGSRCVLFDGVNDTMSTTVGTAATATLFTVLSTQDAAPTSASDVAIASQAQAGGGIFLATTGGGIRQLNGTGTITRNGAASPLTLGTNEFVIATSTITGATPGSRVKLGAFLDNVGFGQNAIAEVILYNRVLTATEITQVQNYLSQRYGISVPTNNAPTSVALDNFSVTDTTLNGWSVLGLVGGQPTRDRYTLNWVTDQGQPALQISNSGIFGINGLPQGRVNLPGGPDTLGGGGDAIRKAFKTSATDTSTVNLSRAKVLHVFMRTTAQNVNRQNRNIAPTVQINLTDAALPPFPFPNGDTLRQRRVTNGGRRFSNEIARMQTLVPDGKYREYIFDYTDNFKGLDFGNVFGFGANAVYNVDSTRIQLLDVVVNPGLITGMTYRHAFNDADRELRVVGNRGSDGVGGDFVPVYTTSAPRFSGNIFIRSMTASNDPLPIQRVSSSATPSIAAGVAGEGAYVLGTTNAYVNILRGPVGAGSLNATLGTITTSDTVVVVDTVGANNAYRINDASTPHRIISNRLWTINQTNLDAAVRFDISINAGGLIGVTRPQNLYIAYRPTPTAPWQALTTYRNGNYLQAFNRTGTEFGQFAIASQRESFFLNAIRESAKATAFELKQNYPNPFNPSTTIQFSVPTTSTVQLEVYNLLGQKVATLLNERMNAGTYSVPFNASNLASGLYFYRIQAGANSASKRMMLIK
jgi:hypothetical protein